MKRRFQFSLRALLIAMTVFAVWLGWKVERGRRNLEAIKAIDALGGTYGVRIEGSKPFLALAKKFGWDERTFYDVRRLSLGPTNAPYDPNKPVGDRELESLARHIALFSNMNTLDLRDSAITNRGIAALPPLPTVTTIYLYGTGVSDGLADSLDKFPALTTLGLTSTGVTAMGVDEIRRRFPGCKVEL